MPWSSSSAAQAAAPAALVSSAPPVPRVSRAARHPLPGARGHCRRHLPWTWLTWLGANTPMAAWLNPQNGRRANRAEVVGTAKASMCPATVAVMAGEIVATQTLRAGKLGVLCAMVASSWAPPTLAQSSLVNRLHANAVESFRQGRFPEAYGRFIALAQAGHPASAKTALWMCEHGPELFGKDWDCAPQEVEDWARAAGVEAPSIGPRHYNTAGSPRTAGSRSNSGPRQRP